MHDALCQGPGLVGANDGGRAESLHRRKTFDQRTSAGHRADTGGQCKGDGGQQPFRDVRYQQPDREDSSLSPGQSSHHPKRKKRDPDAECDGRDQISDAPDLTFQWAVTGRAAPGQRRDPADLGMCAGGVDNRFGRSTDAARAAEYQHRRVQYPRRTVHDVREPLHRRRFPGQRRHVQFQIAAHQSAIGRYPVALVQQHDIAGDNVRGRHRAHQPGAAHPGLRRQVPSQCLDGPTGLAFLQECESGIQPDDDQDGPGQLHRTCDVGQHRREQQQHGQRMSELSGQRARPGRAAARVQFVWSEPLQPSGGFPLRQATGIGGQVS